MAIQSVLWSRSLGHHQPPLHWCSNQNALSIRVNETVHFIWDEIIFSNLIRKYSPVTQKSWQRKLKMFYNTACFDILFGALFNRDKLRLVSIQREENVYCTMRVVWADLPHHPTGTQKAFNVRVSFHKYDTWPFLS